MGRRQASGRRTKVGRSRHFFDAAVVVRLLQVDRLYSASDAEARNAWRLGRRAIGAERANGLEVATVASRRLKGEEEERGRLAQAGGRERGVGLTCQPS